MLDNLMKKRKITINYGLFVLHCVRNQENKWVIFSHLFRFLLLISSKITVELRGEIEFKGILGGIYGEIQKERPRHQVF